MKSRRRRKKMEHVKIEKIGRKREGRKRKKDGIRRERKGEAR